ncbi:MAG: glycosyltransferase family 4 protein [Rhodothermales bacterium]
MRILFIGNNFPPETAPLAQRLFEHGRQWVDDGLDVTVMTDVPNFPEGVVYEGYRNRYTRETMACIDVVRVPLYVTKNAGTLKRIASFISFMLSVIWYSRKVEERPDVVVASSPQFFSAIAGLFVARFKRAPYVLEIRDLWPESIVAVDAMSRNAVIRFFERIEAYLYRKADHIVVVTNAFKRFIVNKGIDGGKITVLKNGADLEAYGRPLDADELDRIRTEFDLHGKFVASYIGTIGMAHRADLLLEAAQRCTDPDIVFLVMGTGAEREALEARQAELQLPNFRLIAKQPKERVAYFLALTDVSVVHLKATPLFRTVIPSKLFEAMAMKKPILLGVEGESRELVEEADAGIAFTPEDADGLLAGVERLRRDAALYRRLAEHGHAYVHAHHDRRVLARRYAELLADVAGVDIGAPVEVA